MRPGFEVIISTPRTRPQLTGGGTEGDTHDPLNAHLRAHTSKMVVTSRMLAAHTNGYPVDAKARFWSTYYRSLKDIHHEEHRPRASELIPKPKFPASAGTGYTGPAVYPKSTYPLILNTISPSVRPSYYL
nr:uncharacterized protein LOC128700317 [Cherax quadricarinatus]